MRPGSVKPGLQVRSDCTFDVCVPPSGAAIVPQPTVWALQTAAGRSARFSVTMLQGQHSLLEEAASRGPWGPRRDILCNCCA